MNKKKYIFAGIFLTVIAVVAGIAYYFDATAINNIIGINSLQTDSVADADLSAMSSASSSPTLDSETDTAAVPAAVASSSAKKAAKKKNNTATAAAGIATPPQTSASAQANATQEQSDISQTFLGDLNGAASDSSGDDGDSTSVDTAAIPSPPVSVAAVPCSSPVNSPSTASRKIIFNEIAWMGSPSSSAAEWIEIKNISTNEVDLPGWELSNASGKIKISFSAGDSIAPGGLLLLVRGSGNAGNVAASGAGVSVVKTYSGDLVNAGDVLALMDPQCGISDYLDASHGWPGGSNTTKQTLERDADGVGWHTSALPGGTPGAENSAGPPPAQYKIGIAFEGSAGGATIASDPAGLVCGASCAGNFASGTRITLTPAAGPNAAFNGWSGLCYGQIICSFTIGANMSITAEFRSTLTPPSGSGVADVSGNSSTSTDNSDISSLATGVATSSPDGGDAGSGESTTTANSSSALSPSHILIAAVQIGGAASSNDLVKLYNPTAMPVDMSGWKLHKKSQTGADYSLKEFPTGSTIAAGQFFVWANSAGGFSDTVGASVSSTETLAADNSVALMDSAGNIIDAVAWGTGSSQYGEGPPYPTSPGANQLLSRRSSDGVMVDTDNNTNDFTLQ